jgi:hypothetical protein
MPFRPRRPTFLRVRPLGHAPPDFAPAGDPNAPLAAATPVEAAHGAFRDTLRALRAGWPAGPLGGEAGDAPAVPPASARDGMHAAAGTYARALRGAGVGLPAALAAVRATLSQDAALLPTAVFTAAHQEAAQCCLEAYYAH